MKIRQVLCFTWVALAFLLSACGGQDAQAAIETGIAQTLQISQLETAAAGAGQAQEQPTATPEGAAAAEEEGPPTDTPTATLSPTPSTALVSVSTDTNCRSGPRIDYTLLTTILVGEEVEVVATYPGDDYVVVRRPGGSGVCWLWLRYANRTDFSAYNLPAATQPPTSTPTLTPTPDWNWNGSWNTYIGPAPYTERVVTLARSGNSVTGSYTHPGGTVTISGTLSAGGQTLSGTWSDSGGAGSGTFTWQIKSGNRNQFVGNYSSGAGAWCGARSGASTPDPCQGP